jgi:hypothetical protein
MTMKLSGSNNEVVPSIPLTRNACHLLTPEMLVYLLYPLTKISEEDDTSKFKCMCESYL